MKVGIRKPSFERSFKARTTGRVKRAVKKEINPLYGTKTMGIIRNPKKAVYNRVYDKTTVGTGLTGVAVDAVTGYGEEKKQVDNESTLEIEQKAGTNTASEPKPVNKKQRHEKLYRKYCSDPGAADGDRKRFFFYAIVLLFLCFGSASYNEYICTGSFIAAMCCFYHRRTIRVIQKMAMDERQIKNDTTV